MFLIFTLLTSMLLCAEMPWQDFRFSAQIPDGTVSIRSQVLLEGETIVLFEADNVIDCYEMYNVTGMNNTMQGFIASQQDDSYFGFVTHLDDPLPENVAHFALPVYNRSGDTPSFQNLSLIHNDPLGDIGQGLPFLDILNVYVTYDDDKIYFAMQNDGGGFPLVDATWGTFYSYMLMMMSPEEDDVPFGMLLTIDQPPYIQPGLYKLMGESYEDMIRIADMQYTIDQDNDLLITECYWEDLFADQDFTAWFDTDDPEFVFFVTTSLITMSGGLEDGDYSELSQIYPQQLSVEFQQNQVPLINNLEIADDSLLTFNYSDANENFPLIAQAVINDSIMIELFPQCYDYSQDVVFLSNGAVDVIENNSWQSITLTVSDNYSDIVQQTITNSSDSQSTDVTQASVQMECYPNPFNPQIFFDINTFYDIDPNAHISVYNLKGQLITKIPAIDHNNGNITTVWNANEYSSGVYFAKLISDGRSLVSKKITLLK